ncbi:hypothetical protein B0H16DRAFT_1741605 [Mycena metata]|uniref:Uncharacterized protein n=1 Tax=Mycena metata TaxID=1033252 RepID=A0AAD7MH43_9AGAR|nr:hypothetical protein B0H16DRAFT_1741605 [Mycena metata]
MAGSALTGLEEEYMQATSLQVSNMNYPAMLHFSYDSFPGVTPIHPRRLQVARFTICRLPNHPEAFALLRRMDWNQLFHTSLLGTRISVQNVREYIKQQVDDPIAREWLGARPYPQDFDPVHILYPGEPILDKLHCVQRSAYWNILECLDLRDRIHLAATASRFYHWNTVFDQMQVTRMVEPYGLCYGDLKLAQAATGMVLSGLMLAALVHLPFTPNDLDMYVHYTRGDDLVTYIERISHRVRYLRAPDNRLINIVETLADDPRKCVAATFHSSTTRGFVEWDRICHYEANFATRGLAMTSPAAMRLDMDNWMDLVRCWEILHKYADRGLSWIYDCPRSHVCGEDLDCPATKRTMQDRGCYLARFPLVNIPVYTQQRRHALSWSYKGEHCKTNEGAEDVHPAGGLYDQTFRRVLDLLQLLRYHPSEVTDVRYHSIGLSADRRSEIDIAPIYMFKRSKMDFAATRDRGAGPCDLYSYKLHQPPQSPSPLRVHPAYWDTWSDEEVDAYFTSESGSVLLRCPATASAETCALPVHIRCSAAIVERLCEEDWAHFSARVGLLRVNGATELFLEADELHAETGYTEWILTLECPADAAADVQVLFDAQAAALRNIMEYDKIMITDEDDNGHVSKDYRAWMIENTFFPLPSKIEADGVIYPFAKALMAASHLTIRNNSSARIPGWPAAVALDKLHWDFYPTRKCLVRDDLGEMDRFVMRDIHVCKYLTRLDPIHRATRSSVYRGHIIGQVDTRWEVPYANPLNCEDSDDFTVDFYNSQLDALEFVALGCNNIMPGRAVEEWMAPGDPTMTNNARFPMIRVAADISSGAAEVFAEGTDVDVTVNVVMDRRRLANGEWENTFSLWEDTGLEGWLGPVVNGFDTIKVVLTDDAMAFWNGGNWTFRPGQHMKLRVSLHRDAGFNGSSRTYSAWLKEFMLLVDEDLLPVYTDDESE